MKIVLHAFGDKLKGVMEIPEDTGYRFKISMEQPIQVFADGYKKFPMMEQPLIKICHFEWNGKVYGNAGHEYDGARVYQLVDITN